MAAQDQTLRTNVIKVTRDKQEGDDCEMQNVQGQGRDSRARDE